MFGWWSSAGPESRPSRSLARRRRTTQVTGAPPPAPRPVSRGPDPARGSRGAPRPPLTGSLHARWHRTAEEAPGEWTSADASVSASAVLAARRGGRAGPGRGGEGRRRAGARAGQGGGRGSRGPAVAGPPRESLAPRPRAPEGPRLSGRRPGLDRAGWRRGGGGG